MKRFVVLFTSNSASSASLDGEKLNKDYPYAAGSFASIKEAELLIGALSSTGVKAVIHDREENKSNTEPNDL